jgi:hypothetical protein
LLLVALAKIDIAAADLVACSSTPSGWPPRVLGGPPLLIVRPRCVGISVYKSNYNFTPHFLTL